jgi:ribonuclease HI
MLDGTFVIRNHLGIVVAAGAGSYALMSALHAEAIACFKGLEYAAVLGIRIVVLETDAAVLAEALSNSSVDGLC